MATIYYKIFRHHKKADGTYNIKYCLTHKGKQVYYASPHFVSDKQIKKDLTIRDTDVLDKVNSEIAGLRSKVTALGMATGSMEAKDLLQRITTNESASGDIDFLTFCREHIASLLEAGRTGSASTLRAAANNLSDFFASQSVPISSVTSTRLRQFEAYLKKERKQVRVNQNGREVTLYQPGLGPSGIYSTMRDVRILFNACRTKYNTEHRTVITHYPFDFYKVPAQPRARKKGGDLSVADMQRIRDMRLGGGRALLARDIFMLSFYLCGMNAKDIYLQQWELREGRIGYERSKTRGKRGDNAFISIRVPDEAMPLLERYTAKVLHRRYSNNQNFLKAVDAGMDQISASIGKPISFYHARHTFATLAFNKCGFSKDEIAAALNHVDQSRIVTERYIDSDWSVVDRVQAGVLGLLMP